MPDTMIVLKVCQSGTCQIVPFAYCDSESAADQLTEQYKKAHWYLYTPQPKGHNEAVGVITREVVAFNTLIR